MIIKVLGTGTSQGVPVIGCDCEVCRSDNKKDKRLRSSIFIDLGQEKILIDSGPDMRSQFLNNELDDLSAILITHEHNDHVAGLDDVRPINFKWQKTIPVYAEGRVMKELKSRFYYAFGNTKPGLPKLELQEINPPQKILIGKTEVLPIRVHHGHLPILGFRIGNFAYLTDVKLLPEESLDQLQNLDVLITSALHREWHYSHSNLEEAKILVKELAPQKAYFTHMSHYMGLHKDLENELQGLCDIAFDGLTIELNKP
jgi:phosphoribosyl 1,2-cyclic phosphate phosphodiesterase